MRILVFTTLFPNDVETGKGSFIRHRVLALREAGAEVRVVAPVPYFPFRHGFGRWSRSARIALERREQGIPVHHPRTPITPKFGMRYYGSWMHLAVKPVVERILSTYPIDLIDAHYLYPDGLAALRIARDLNLKMVVTARGTDAHTYPQFSSLRPRLREVLQGAGRVFAVSESLKLDLTPTLPPGRGVVVTPNGVDVGLFRPLPRAAARRRLRVSEKRALLVGIGRLVPVKRWELAIEALAFLREARPETRINFCLVGGGPLKIELQRRIQSLGMLDRIVLVGERAQHELPYWLSAADGLLHPSEREGWPNVVLEALACGTPVIGSKIPSIDEVAPSPEHSLLVDEMDPESLADAVFEGVTKKWSRERLVARAREYAWPRIGARILEQLRRVHEHSVSP